MMISSFLKNDDLPTIHNFLANLKSIFKTKICLMNLLNASQLGFENYLQCNVCVITCVITRNVTRIIVGFGNIELIF